MTGCGAAQFAVFQEGTVHGLTTKNSEISGGNVGYFGHGTKVMDHTYMWNCDECVQYGDTITDSYFYIGPGVSGLTTRTSTSTMARPTSSTHTYHQSA